MNKKKTRPTAATAGQVTIENMSKTGAHSQANYNMEQSPKQGTVESFLSKGKENAVPAEYLVKILGLKSDRELRLLITQERTAGALILSDCRGKGGYYLPADGIAGKLEISAFVATLQARTATTQQILKAARNALKGVEGQTNLEGLL